MSRFAILLGGDVEPTPRLYEQVADARVIAADSGIIHAAALGLSPQLWIGDFDSSDAAAMAANANVERTVFPSDKDKTDGELAIDAAIARGATALILVGAFGGPRCDHSFLHLTLAMRLAEAGMPVLLTSGVREGWPLPPGGHAFDFGAGTMFSVLAFSDLAGLTIAGAKWPLRDVAVPFGSSLTLSNMVSGRLEIALRSGRALLLAHLQIT